MKETVSQEMRNIYIQRLLDEIQEFQIFLWRVIHLVRSATRRSTSMHSNDFLQGAGLGHVLVGPLQYVVGRPVLFIDSAGEVAGSGQQTGVSTSQYALEELLRIKWSKDK